MANPCVAAEFAAQDGLADVPPAVKIYVAVPGARYVGVPEASK